MSYASLETSTEDGQPIELYLFSQRGAANITTYTSADTEITYDGRVYTPVSIKRSSPQLSQKASSGSISITMPRSDQFVQRYLQGQPPLPDTVKIYRAHTTDGLDPEFITFFDGDVAMVKFKDDKAVCTLTTLSQRLASSIPKRTYSWACNHILYDAQCQVGRESYRTDAIVASVAPDGLSAIIGDFPGWTGPSITDRTNGDSNFFGGGMALWQDPRGIQSRAILGHNVINSTLYFQVAFDTLSPTVRLQLYAGCLHSPQSCVDRFDNIENYGGFPFVPSTNPFSEGLLIDVNWQPWG
jgi:uncharacterized phage protein (TIGR02218 family)